MAGVGAAITSQVMDGLFPQWHHMPMPDRAPTPLPDAASFAGQLRRFRTARRLSQLDLALTCGISARHLSFLETGRANPSREMVLQLAEGLLLPLTAQNALLQAAGFAAVYPTSPLTSEALGPPCSATGTGMFWKQARLPLPCWPGFRPGKARATPI